MNKFKNNIICTFVTFILAASAAFTNLYLKISSDTIMLIILRVILLSLLSYFLPDVFKSVKKLVTKSKVKKELRLMKKLFVILGSVRPVDFSRLMKILISKAVCFKNDLESIYEAHQKSAVDKEEFYRCLMEDTKDINTRLFYEKLNMAANYDFDLAVKSITDDFKREKREHERLIKKRVELINIIGITGLFIVITILMIYLLSPWMEMMEISNL